MQVDHRRARRRAARRDLVEQEAEGDLREQRHADQPVQRDSDGVVARADRRGGPRLGWGGGDDCLPGPRAGVEVITSGAPRAEFEDMLACSKRNQEVRGAGRAASGRSLRVARRFCPPREDESPAAMQATTRLRHRVQHNSRPLLERSMPRTTADRFKTAMQVVAVLCIVAYFVVLAHKGSADIMMLASRYRGQRVLAGARPPPAAQSRRRLTRRRRRCDRRRSHTT